MAIPALDNVTFAPAPPKAETAPVMVQALCDSCGVKASFEASKDSHKLVFCGHHIRKNAASLLDRGFKISPENYEFA